jgi:hypothetical protein
MERIRNKVFSVEEANRLIPYLEATLRSLSDLARDIVATQREISVLSVIEGSGATDGSADVRELRGKETGIARIAERFRALLDDLGSRGCIVRDLDLGLVDFYTMSGGRVVYLCWRRGETHIGHWHPLDEGFSGRRSLDELP